MADWLAIKSEYIAGGISQRELAKKHGVSPSTLRDRARRENWDGDSRSISLKTAQKAAEKISDAQSDIASIKAGIDRTLWLAIDRAITELTTDDRLDTSDLRKIVQCYTELRKLPDDSDKRSKEAHNAIVRAIMGISDGIEYEHPARTAFAEFVAEENRKMSEPKGGGAHEK